jgi:hypothetical protein
LKGRVHDAEARFLRAHTQRLIKFTLPGPMTIVDTVADRHYGDRVKLAFAFADLLNQEALALQADGVDIIQFDEPAFNVYLDEVADWGIRPSSARRRGSPARQPFTFAMATASRPTSIGKKRSATSGASTRRCFRCWPGVRSIRCRSSACTRMCRPT